MKYLIEQDDCLESPREWDNLGTVITWHRLYEFEETSRLEPSEWLKEHKTEFAVCLPIYMYEHSGITLSTSPFSCRWDSGQIGYIYVTKERVRKEYGVKRITKKLLDKVAGYLKGEIDTLDQYVTGHVYCVLIKDDEGDVIDSLCGIYGYEYAEDEAEALLVWHKEQVSLKIKATIAANTCCM